MQRCTAVFRLVSHHQQGIAHSAYGTFRSWHHMISFSHVDVQQENIQSSRLIPRKKLSHSLLLAVEAALTHYHSCWHWKLHLPTIIPAGIGSYTYPLSFLLALDATLTHYHSCWQWKLHLPTVISAGIGSYTYPLSFLLAVEAALTHCHSCWHWTLCCEWLRRV